MPKLKRIETGVVLEWARSLIVQRRGGYAIVNGPVPDLAALGDEIKVLQVDLSGCWSLRTACVAFRKSMGVETIGDSLAAINDRMTDRAWDSTSDVYIIRGLAALASRNLPVARSLASELRRTAVPTKADREFSLELEERFGLTPEDPHPILVIFEEGPHEDLLESLKAPPRAKKS